MPSISRRRFVKSGLIGLSGVYVTTLLSGCGGDNDPGKNLGQGTFKHGVASGDPLTDSVILWTRVTPNENTTESVRVAWEVADDSEFKNVIASDSGDAVMSSDFTIKVDVQGLEANTRYYYRFKSGTETTAVGRTRTLPDSSSDQLKLAVLSCSNFPAGFFHVYDTVAQRELDLVLHLGDYIYEYGRGGYASERAEQLGRLSEPAGELFSLDDYRTRYAQYRTDLALQAAHAAAPFLLVWDDHEVANDAWRNGAENHNEGEGSYSDRQLAAMRAYFEWLPIRPESAGVSGDLVTPSSIYRQFQWGDLANILMLDTRNESRDEPLSLTGFFDTTSGEFDFEGLSAAINDPDRQLLGGRQLDWLASALSTSSATWQLLGQQVLMGRMDLPFAIASQQMSIQEYAELAQLALIAQRAQQADPTLSAEELTYLNANQERLTPQVLALLQAPNIPYNLDAWDAFGHEREAVYAIAKQASANLVVLAGDTHNAWANELTDAEGSAIGVELATSSVTSPGLEEYLDIPEDSYPMAEAGIVSLVDGLKYMNAGNRGFLTLHITHEQITAHWEFVSSVEEENYTLLSSRAKKMVVRAGERVLLESS